MHLNLMDPKLIAGVVLIVLILVAGVALYVRKQRTTDQLSPQCGDNLLTVVCPAPFVPVTMRQTGTRGAWNGTSDISKRTGYSAKTSVVGGELR